MTNFMNTLALDYETAARHNQELLTYYEMSIESADAYHYTPKEVEWYHNKISELQKEVSSDLAEAARLRGDHDR